MSLISEFKDKKIAILGFGVEGKATAEYLYGEGFTDITVLDQNTEDEDFISKKFPSFGKILGDGYLDSLTDFELIVITPGINPSFQPIKNAEEKGVKFITQIGLFFDLCPAKIIGVTGTKGKGTTSALTYEILKNAGYDAHLGGNIGVPAISFLDKLDERSWVVLELSSFQLQSLKKSPHIAVALMITSEHLDYHKDEEEYAKAKSNIVRYQSENDFAVLNTDYKNTAAFKSLTKAKVFEVGRNKENEGAMIKDGKVVLNINGESVEVADLNEIILKGEHNLENIAAAGVASCLAGADLKTIKNTIKAFKGLEHRLEFVAEKNGISFYNDSFATVPESTIAALKSFDGNVILIAGGSSKNSDYQELGSKIAQKVKAVVLIGETADEIEREIRKEDKEITIIKGFTKMDDMVKACIDNAEEGDFVLLSPAAASFGLFKNYKDRGEQFKEAVRELS